MSDKKKLRERQPRYKTRKKIEQVIKKEREISVSRLNHDFNFDYYSIIITLDLLVNDGKVKITGTKKAKNRKVIWKL